MLLAMELDLRLVEKRQGAGSTYAPTLAPAACFAYRSLSYAMGAAHFAICGAGSSSSSRSTESTASS